MQVSNPGLRKGITKVSLIKVWKFTRGREAAYIGNRADCVAIKQRKKLIDRACRMSDRPYSLFWFHRWNYSVSPRCFQIPAKTLPVLHTAEFCFLHKIFATKTLRPKELILWTFWALWLAFGCGFIALCAFEILIYLTGVKTAFISATAVALVSGPFGSSLITVVASLWIVM